MVVLASLLVLIEGTPPAAAAPTASSSVEIASSSVGTAVAAVETASAERDWTQEPGVRDSVVRLYRAVFNRDADPEGLTYWVNRYVEGVPLAAIANEFMASAEWRGTYGPLDDDQFVATIYGNVLGREPDPEGYAYWRQVLASGATRTQLLLGFSESQELILTTATATPVPPPPRFAALPPNSGSGRRIVYSNSRQLVWLVEGSGQVSNSYPVSGRRGVPASGTYRVYSKSPVAWAGHDGITMRHMIRFAHGRSLAIGFHSIPRYPDGRPMQTEAELGQFRSSGCIRQRDDLAAALYAWAPVGTTVVVTP